MTTPSPLPPPSGGGHALVVDEDNVLAARKVVLQATEDAQRALEELRQGLEIQAPAHDEISLAPLDLGTGNRREIPTRTTPA